MFWEQKDCVPLQKARSHNVQPHMPLWYVLPILVEYAKDQAKRRAVLKAHEEARIRVMLVVAVDAPDR